jgi:hypothetical protein
VPARPASLLVCALVAILAAGCQTTASPSPGSSAGSSEPLPTGGPTGSETAPPALAPTSEALIAAALAAGTITEEQSLLYRALALFDAPTLPADFRSPVANISGAMELFGEIEQKEASLSQATLDQLRPYRVRPNDPASIFSAPTAAGSLTLVHQVAANADWAGSPAAGGRARVWVRAGDGAAALLAGYARDVTTVWNAFPGIFTYPKADMIEPGLGGLNPDTAIDIYFVDVGALDPRRPACVVTPSLSECAFKASNFGFAQRAEPKGAVASSGYLVIDRARIGDELIGTIAHELAHASQFGYDRFESLWLMESGATWVEHEVLKKLGKVPGYPYAYLQQFFKDLELPLGRVEDGNAYASWLYMFFASMEEGDAIMETIWTAAAAPGVQGERAVDEVFAFEDHFDDFSVRNWNREPVDRRYESYDDTFPRSHQPPTQNVETTLKAGQEEVLDESLPALSAVYFDYVISPNARKITFENTLVGIPGAHVWAIRNVDETWQEPEDWTDIPTKEFCRDIPEEDVGQLVLIFSNSNLSTMNTPSEPARLTGKATGCGDWRGTMSATLSWSSSRGSGEASSTFEGMWTATDDMLMDPCQAQYLGDLACTVYLPSGTIKWTWHSVKIDPTPEHSCEQTTGGSLPAGVQPLHPDQEMLRVQPLEGGGFKYWGVGNFVVTPATCWAALEANNQQPPSYFYVDERASSTKPPSAGGNCHSIDWTIDSLTDSITGACVEYDYGYTKLTYEWNLTRIGPPPPG